MSVSHIDTWRTPGCSDKCWPRDHDLGSHERHGYAQGAAARKPSLIRTGPLVVDLARMVVEVDGAEIHLSERAWGILAYLAEHAGAWCANADIVRAVWGPEWDGGDPYLVNTNLERLRGRVGPARRLIETARGGGRRRLRMEAPTP